MFWLVACQGGAFPGESGTTATILDSADTAAPRGETGVGDTSAGVPDEPLPICINEWMADNQSSYKDAAGRYPDWVELHNPGEDSVDFGGWTFSIDSADQAPFAFPAGSVLGAGEFLLLAANEGDGPAELPFQLDSTGGQLVLTGTDGRTSTVRWGAQSGDFAAARASDCCLGEACLAWEYRGTPGQTNVASPVPTEMMVALGSTWRFKDDGIEVDNWQDSAFDDAAWAQGSAPLGYGDEGLVSTIGYGPDANAKYMTSWFRLHFSISNAAAATGAALGLRRDDGAAAYLNGDELLRSNLPEGQLSGSTAALTSMSGVNETAVWTLPVNAEALVEGENILAVELHQHAATSSDAVLDAFFTVYR